MLLLRLLMLKATEIKMILIRCNLHCAPQPFVGDSTVGTANKACVEDDKEKESDAVRCGAVHTH